MNYFKALSRKQLILFATTLAVAAAILGAGFFIAGAPQEQDADEHHHSNPVKYFFFTAMCLFSAVYLTCLGRPDNSTDKSLWYPSWIHLSCMVLSVLVAGFILGKSPNPMEGAVKVFKTMAGLYPAMAPKLAAFVFFIVLAVTANKVICGWACPFGALQELAYSVPTGKKLKAPFALTNTIRVALFVFFLLFLFYIRPGKVIYHWVNPFNLFSLTVGSTPLVIVLAVSLVGGLVFYRPFCQLVCPFGLLSWFAESFSVLRVDFNRDKCTDCGLCVSACPLDAAAHRLQGRRPAADCFSCGRCLNCCPHDCISYGLRRSENQARQVKQQTGQ